MLRRTLMTKDHSGVRTTPAVQGMSSQTPVSRTHQERWKQGIHHSRSGCAKKDSCGCLKSARRDREEEAAEARPCSGVKRSFKEPECTKKRSREPPLPQTDRHASKATSALEDANKSVTGTARAELKAALLASAWEIGE